MAVLLVIGLSGCEDKAGPAEKLGKEIDKATEESLRQMNEAAANALKELNETAVKLNKELGEASAALGEESKKMAVVLDDATVTSKVRAAILAEPRLKSLQIDVKTKNGVVTLKGSVDSTENRDLVEQLVGSIEGVKEVDSRLAVRIKQE